MHREGRVKGGSGKGKGLSKKLAQREHARRRAQERFGLTLNRSAMRALVGAIQAGKARVLSRTSNRAAVLALEVEGVERRVVYDYSRSTIVTFLPDDDTEVPEDFQAYIQNAAEK